MSTTIERLATFCAGTDPTDVPDEVQERTKMILCDTVISGLCTFGLERGDMARAFARTMGPEPQAIVLGDTDGRRVSLLAAAYANADLMNVLDADETFFNSAHFAALSFAPALAEAERGRAGGAQLLHAAAVSFDVNARLNLGTSLLELGDDGRVRFSQLSSHGYAGLGAAAAIGILRGFPSDRLADAMGLATWLAPTAKNGYMGRRRQFNSLKYAPNGQIAHAGVLAALLADAGYRGDHDSLDTEPGFLEAQGYGHVDRAAIVAELGSTWWITETSVKPYPSCRFGHAAIDALVGLRQEPDFDVASVVDVEVRLGPGAWGISQFRDPVEEIPNNHLAPFAGQFNMPVMAALGLLGVPPGPAWYRPDTLKDPAVRALAAKVRVTRDEVLASEWESILTADGGGRLRRTRGSVTVTTADARFDRDTDYAIGDPWRPETAVSWSFLEEKFASFAGDLITPGRRDEIVSLFRELDAVDDVAGELCPLLQPDGGGS